jgi:hypothetical protein
VRPDLWEQSDVRNLDGRREALLDFGATRLDRV